MERERARIIAIILFAIDAVGMLLSFSCAYVLKQLMPEPYGYVASLDFYGWMVSIYSFTLLASLWLLGRYSAPLKQKFSSVAATSFKGVIIATSITIIALFLAKEYMVSRLLVGFFAVTSFLYTLASWTVVWQLLKRSGVQIRALIVGTSPWAEAVAKSLEEDPHTKVEIAGFLKLSADETLYSEKMNVLGTLADLKATLDKGSIDDVFFATPFSNSLEMANHISTCEEVGVRAHVLCNIYNPTIAKVIPQQIGGLPILTFTTTPTRIGALFVKYAFDRIEALILIAIFSPFFLAIALAIKLTSKGGVIFKQMRSGLNARPFVMYKFRTMVKGAEEIKKELLPQNEMRGPVFKLKEDPRITKIGAFLRKSSLDELPQFFNVLKGDMSLVGPRPLPVEEVEKFDRWQRRRQSLKPGITCIWQISGRNEIDFDQWMKLDLQYIDSWSLGLDLVILLKTIPAVLSGKGAR